MLVRCTSNNIRTVDVNSALAQELGRWFGTDGDLISLEVGKLYVVYAMQVKDGWLRYFIADEDYSATQYPLSHFAIFFDVVDQRLSRCWTLWLGSTAERCANIMLTFSEWVCNPSFYERLIDGDSEAQSIFRKRKEYMDLEFPDPSISAAAEVLDGGWLQCPKCDEAFESEAVYGLVRCPKCGAVLTNPMYRATCPAEWQLIEENIMEQTKSIDRKQQE